MQVFRGMSNTTWRVLGEDWRCTCWCTGSGRRLGMCCRAARVQNKYMSKLAFPVHTRGSHTLKLGWTLPEYQSILCLQCHTSVTQLQLISGAAAGAITTFAICGETDYQWLTGRSKAVQLVCYFLVERNRNEINCRFDSSEHWNSFFFVPTNEVCVTWTLLRVSFLLLPSHWHHMVDGVSLRGSVSLMSLGDALVVHRSRCWSVLLNLYSKK